ncbi:hypothetical protein HPB48_006427 [Haemaphysalis longicornis]|uniref:Uncharacterized protein n=1 Tax=Haemaphysalis longicornis TaxID=44386 RepID=A0A9J6FLM3_HAELO|nr:hypothetical protein HPB48_006427 [Haemaphysalis longicornis]
MRRLSSGSRTSSDIPLAGPLAMPPQLTTSLGGTRLYSTTTSSSLLPPVLIAASSLASPTARLRARQPRPVQHMGESRGPHANAAAANAAFSAEDTRQRRALPLFRERALLAATAARRLL